MAFRSMCDPHPSRWEGSALTELSERLCAKYFGDAIHPYVTFEREVARVLQPQHTLLDAGCGRTAPVLVKYRGKAARLIGVDMVEFPTPIQGIELYNANLANTQMEDASVDVIMCRSVVEHLTDPVAVFREFRRILRPGGRVIFLTANLWDYASLIAAIVPNRWHPWIVARTEGRREEDVFPIRYRSNTKAAIYRHAEAAGFRVTSFRYLGQYPSYFMFNGALFLIATAYEKLLSAVPVLHCLRGWICCTLTKD
jgi:ubiquinone/menaquinone biosynthesis C-methylase UbiE